jgi:hypothetical protein
VGEVLPLRIPPADPLTVPPTAPPAAALVADAERLRIVLGGVGLRTIRTWDAGGLIPAPIRISGRVFWLIAEIDEWLRCGAPPRAEWEARKAASRKQP